MKSDWLIKPVLLASTLAFMNGCTNAVDLVELAQAPLAFTQDALTSEPAEVWRPFSEQSPWNTKVASGAPVDAESTSLIDDWRTSSPFGPQLNVNMRDFSIPLYWADENTPKVPVRCKVGGTGFEGNNGMEAAAMVPIPEGATPDSQSDGHLLVVDRSTQREWGLFRAARDGGQWTCGLGADMDLSGDGVRPIAETNPTWFTSHGPRACGFPLAAGLIRPEEIKAGRIEHALVVAYPHIRAGIYTPPASTAQVKVEDAIKTRGIPCGGRIQLDPELDLDSLPLSEGARVIARALQEYGAFVGDFSGSLSLYADNSQEALSEWAQLPIDDVSKLDLTRFRVLELGTLYDNGNGD